MNMLKSLLILILASTQLLARDGVSVYLCVSSDWVYSVHFGSDECPPCGGQKPNDEVSGEHPSHGEECASQGCGTNPVDRAASHVSSPSVSLDSCGCTHFPFVVEVAQPRGLYRSSAVSDAHRILALAVAPPSGMIEWQADRRWASLQRNNRVLDSLLMAVISTVVIRT